MPLRAEYVYCGLLATHQQCRYVTSIPDFTKELTVVINEDEPELAASFTVPEGLLVEHSDFFKAACRNEWLEATSRVIKLPQVDGESFRAYLYWVYKGEIAFDTSFGSQDQYRAQPLVSASEALPTSQIDSQPRSFGTM